MSDRVCECPRCSTRVVLEGHSDQASCPSCGLRFSEERSDEATSLVRGYFRDLRQILFHPFRFFRRMPVQGGLSGPLAFALITHWVGSVFSFLWGNLGGSHPWGAFFRHAPQWTDGIDYAGRRATLDQLREQAQEWISGVSSVIIDPFFTLFSVLFTAGFVFIGARILVPQADGVVRPVVTYESAVRIVSFAMATSIVAVVPFAGTALGPLLGLVYLIIGVREVYRIGTARSIVIGLFPKILIVGAVFGGLFLIFYFLTRLVFSFI